ncbi:NAD-dependent epimerase/dehydratase family protein [Candidatus Daviesbacteria bacterium]|nr:NAD-dependent epimerase/dehydratase family protein [Candidatus Daviesbacteria bacterium]
MKRIFVAGAGGFIGKRTVKILKTRGYNVITSGKINFKNLNQAKIFFKKQKPQIIINCAIDTGGISYVNKHPGEIFINNTLVSLNLQESARLSGVEKLINILSNSAYPPVNNGLLKEQFWGNGPMHESVLVIGSTSRHTYINSMAFNRQFGIQYSNLIVGNVYGPDDYFDPEKSYALGALIRKIMDAKENSLKEVTVWGSGKPVRDWVYVDDLVEAFIKSIKTRTDPFPINISSGIGISIKKLALMIQVAAGFRGKLVFDTSKPDGSPYKVMDTSYCKKVFNWVPKTKIEDGIKKTITWYNKNIL